MGATIDPPLLIQTVGPIGENSGENKLECGQFSPPRSLHSFSVLEKEGGEGVKNEIIKRTFQEINTSLKDTY